MAYTVTITGTGSTDCCVRINGTVYWSSAALTVNAGDEITCIAMGSVILNGTTVAKSSGSSTVSYVLTVVNNVQIVLDNSTFLSYKVTITMSEQPADPTAPKDGHNVLIDGAACQIESGTVMIGGTVYEIEKGEVLIGGTVYEIPFAGGTCTVTITGTGETSACYVTIDGTKYTSAATVDVTPGTTMHCYAYSSKKGGAVIKVDGTSVGTASQNNAVMEYDMEVTNDLTVTLTSKRADHWITITTS